MAPAHKAPYSNPNPTLVKRRIPTATNSQNMNVVDPVNEGLIQQSQPETALDLSDLPLAGMMNGRRALGYFVRGNQRKAGWRSRLARRAHNAEAHRSVLVAQPLRRRALRRAYRFDVQLNPTFWS